jgi:hypothetical protein
MNFHNILESFRRYDVFTAVKIRVVAFCVIMPRGTYETKNDVIRQKTVKQNYLRHAIFNFRLQYLQK